MNRKCFNETDIASITAKLEEAYPDAQCELNFNNPFQLIIAVVLSAQTTDAAVNKVTPALFKAYPDPYALADAQQSDVERLISAIGLYRNKSKNIIALSRKLLDEHDGQVPSHYEELTALPGVGRKTANVVLAEAFGEQRIAVDTHVFRVANRIGLSDAPDVLETEKSLMEILPHDSWTRMHHLLIIHGRRCCHARRPDCPNCCINKYCINNGNF